jgi:hypothetical protein
MWKMSYKILCMGIFTVNTNPWLGVRNSHMVYKPAVFIWQYISIWITIIIFQPHLRHATSLTWCWEYKGDTFSLQHLFQPIWMFKRNKEWRGDSKTGDSECCERVAQLVGSLDVAHRKNYEEFVLKKLVGEQSWLVETVLGGIGIVSYSWM